jgi:hypothetical protein
LLTFGGGNNPLKDGNEDVARVTFNGGASGPGGDPTRETALTAAVWVRYPGPGVESRRGALARRIDGGGLLGDDGSVGAKSARGRGYL